MIQPALLAFSMLGLMLTSPAFATFPERFQFVPWKWVSLWGPGEEGTRQIQGRYGVGSYLLLQDANRINQEHIFTEFENEMKWRVSIYVTPTLDADDQPLFKATCQEEEVIVEQAMVDTVYQRIGSFKPTDEGLNGYRHQDAYHLNPEGEEIVVYEKRLTYKGYHLVSAITIGSEGNVLTFYEGAAAKIRGEHEWSLRVTKTGMATRESSEGTLMEVPTVRVERKGSYLKGLSEDSLIIDTVLRYGRQSFLQAAGQTTEATVDSAGNPTYAQQESYGEITKMIYRLGNFQVNLHAGG